MIFLREHFEHDFLALFFKLLINIQDKSKHLHDIIVSSITNYQLVVYNFITECS